MSPSEALPAVDVGVNGVLGWVPLSAAEAAVPIPKIITAASTAAERFTPTVCPLESFRITYFEPALCY